MNIMADKFARAPIASLRSNLEFVCWSRMQAEAGQALEEIVRRKELERQSGNGVFFWGVGNPPAKITSALAKVHHPVAVVFSIMKSKPKAGDVSPSRIVMWQTYIDRDGLKREMPDHVLVTSRGDTTKGAKRSHYALICYSAAPLAIERGCPFDPGAYRNTGEMGKPIGASQVTALLQPIREESRSSSYEVNLRATLHDSYWVRLEDPVDVNAAAMTKALKSTDRIDWLDSVRKMKAVAGQVPASVRFPKSLQLDLM
ncbi:hypothetical protein [Asticcacaulis taihuensis]|uniref:Uncharacterized protein n=1 Tax=Asticcacaulis taihuensis TaxID=260084 RepID=A0A1G4SW00_9CAUL|nr:hypothetical protein [Asticcacaulis taihuensis]SCW73221.1 hypothetical protein SAMN02927928_3034 [Asticcacaulis taihuensis]